MREDLFSYDGCIAIINGPNMNLLGLREPDIYGTKALETINADLQTLVKGSSVKLQFFQSNLEGEIINYIQRNYAGIDGILLNPASCQVTGCGILDVLLAVKIPFVEVHMSNIFAREKVRQRSIFASKAIGSIVGFRGYVYELGLRALLQYLTDEMGR